VPGLDPTSQLAALIRLQVTSLRQQQAGSKAAARQQPSTSDSASANADMAALIAQRVRAINPDDPQRERKALRVFLETVLLSELGSNLLNDPGFAPMVDHVQSEMEADPDLTLAARHAAQVLLKSAAE
jgi:hypothetical protein